MSVHHYIDAFTRYLRSGDASAMGHFCENSDHIKRLAVYRNGFYKGCVDALAANFPVCQKLLGSESFRNVARLYVDLFPPQQGTLVGYGQSFPGFLADFMSQQGAAEPSLRSLLSLNAKASASLNLADIARLDYAWLTSLMSADSDKTLTAENATILMEQGHDLARARVRLNASVLLLSVGSGSLSEWISLKIPNNDEGAQNSESSAAGFVMFWRVQGAVQARALSLAEVALMQALQGEGKGRLLGEAFDAALEVDENFEVSDVFSACLQNELLDIEML
ncbi:DNA-binding domain-containing protein [Neptunomonas qingdaonensis]|uniref:Putative DNA-binding domain-containing protein n=1 Tax=Neptunomonas qingdaonensis TaxID=1045558 RepID=A0A1I2RK53_9GAMM|nr:DNA-binding domain-containing protein [Neptunomonas qingdaonensis]SFG40948.1 Putative DNA-binding domain-containing protein [Neptunomonas qingdaonensis]